ncbi:hypothetical protein EG68_00557 [Paragonimus skrjabini miyazakii]|uniref:C2H2-type domain-containing protein n=1 Tax=Paragonimus skrjabini miyazakii TaxID=59628 RepID=A0A8S9Z8X9_9TREM|nr:hypothetical protein EG68_00557 [Paragonimus skrjabini miyazakii]
MLQRPTLMPPSMRTVPRTVTPSRQDDPSDNPITVSDDSREKFRSFCDGEEIVIVEPTDPDEDRLKQKQLNNVKSNCNRTIIIKSHVSKPQTSLNHTQTVVSSTTCSTETIPTVQPAEQPKSCEIALSLQEALQSILSNVNRNAPVPNVAIQPVLTTKGNATPNLVGPCVVPNPLTALWLHSSTPNPAVNAPAPPATVNPTSAFEEIAKLAQSIAPLNPLVAAVLVNCATVNMISQLAGSFCAPIYNTSALGTNSTFQTGAALNSILPTLLSNFSLSTPHQETINVSNNTGSMPGITVTSPTSQCQISVQSKPSSVTSSSLPTPTVQTVEFLRLPAVSTTTVSSATTPPTAIPATSTTKTLAAVLTSSIALNRASCRVKRFKCPMPNCDFAFYSRFNQTEHIRTHTGERPFSCPEPECSAAFKRRRDLRDHWTIHISQHPSSETSQVIKIDEDEADYENFGVARPSVSVSSMDSPTPTPSSTTESLNMVISGGAKTESPGESSETDNPNESDKSIQARYHCSFPGCAKSYARRHRLNQHASSHTGPRPIKCNEPNCNAQFFSDQDLMRHKIAHQYSTDMLTRRRHTCPYPNCEKAYSKLNKLKEHVRSHTGERPFVCREPGCGAAFIRLYGVRRHELTHVFGRRRAKRLTRFPTTLVNIINGTASVQQTDEAIEAKVEQLVSAITSRTMRRTAQNPIPILAKPVESNEPNPEGGDLSVESSASSRALPAIAPKTTALPSMRPLSPISGTPGMRRPHVCPFKECGKAFPKLNKLREHICRHTGERPFVCDKCKASFVRMYDLRRHGNIHLRGAQPRNAHRLLAPRPLEALESKPTTSENSDITVKPESVTVFS